MNRSPIAAVIAISYDDTYLSLQQVTKTDVLDLLCTVLNDLGVTGEDLINEKYFNSLERVTQTFYTLTSCSDQRAA